MNASPAWSLSARLGQGPPILVFGIPVLGLTLPAVLQEVGRLSLPLQFLGTLMMSFFFFFDIVAIAAPLALSVSNLVDLADMGTNLPWEMPEVENLCKNFRKIR